MNKIELLKKLNKKAIKNNDIPVSCLIYKNDKLISYAYNKKNKMNNPLYHAEIIAIQKAARKLKSWNLSDCELFVTLFPCKMCYELINSARIKKIYYILDATKEVNDTINKEKIYTDEYNYFENELKTFFSNKR